MTVLIQVWSMMIECWLVYRKDVRRCVVSGRLCKKHGLVGREGGLNSRECLW